MTNSDYTTHSKWVVVNADNLYVEAIQNRQEHSDRQGSNCVHCGMDSSFTDVTQ